MGNDNVPLQSPGIEWQWETTKDEFKNGSELSATQQAFLLESFNNLHEYEITLEDVQTWSTRGSDSEFPAQDLTLYTFTNVQTRDKVYVWNYGMGDNDFGTLHFALDGDHEVALMEGCGESAWSPSVSAFTLGKNHDGDLEFYDDHWELPETASEDTRKVLRGVLQWFNAIEDWPCLAEEVAKKMEPGRSMASLKWKAPTCDPYYWKEIAGWGEDEDPE